MNALLAISATVLLLVLNALFVGAEFALISARRSSIEPMAQAGSRLAKITLGAMENVSVLLAGAQLGVTVCTLGLGALGEPALADLLHGPFEAIGLPGALLHPLSFAIALGVVTFLHVVVGEMVPKNIALALPDRSVLVLAPLLVGFVRLGKPVIILLNAVASLSLRAVGVEPKDEVASVFTRDEVAGLVEESHREGLLAEDEHELLTGALSFDERTARSVLLAPEGLVTVPTTITPRELENLAAETGFTRFPVLDDAEEMTGYLHLKDVLETRAERRASPVAAKWVRPLAHVGAEDSLRTALATMQHSGAHLARVTGAGGAVLGLVALEDILEELVGEIRDDAVRGGTRHRRQPA
ncbi:hemolysin family protein [Frankia sp. AgKG'84/4]|uniref:hemolysin family protein n=1 Tax=Frankia sp. AgKG'84/4 TaxID=573490 RepID=UPI00200F57D1|nr:hemolysin family protein [Frankia sp. AgKG'84/4]MCL9796360.1 hemolysin family protein [Frankia sp. AgKG'84/4]